MNLKVLIMLGLTIALMASHSSPLLSQDSTSIFLVYGTLYSDWDRTIEVDGGYTILVRNATNSIEGLADVGSGSDKGKYVATLIDYNTNNAAQAGDILEILAKPNDETSFVLYASYVILSEDISAQMIQLDVSLQPSAGAKHDRMAANNNAWFNWIERKVAWYPEMDGHLSSSGVSTWDAGLVSERVLVTANNPCVVIRFECIKGDGGTNYMFGFTDDAPTSGADSVMFHWHNMKRGLYIHSTGAIKTVYNGSEHSTGDELPVSGTYDLKIELGSDGVVHFAIDDVSDYTNALSNFAPPVWSDTTHWDLASEYHIQINVYSTNTKVYDVWDSPQIPTSVADLPSIGLFLQNYPNPFNPRTTMSFMLPANVYAEMKIYDVKGRLVKTLLGKTMEAGRHTLTWEGKDNRGLSVPSGIYFCKLTAGNDSETRKIIVIR